MWAWIDHAAGLVAQYPHLAQLGTFLAAIIEALAVVGSIVPGTFIVMGIAGAAAAAGQPMLPFLGLAVLGAVIGDYLSYWLGFRFRDSVRLWRPLAAHPEIMTAAEGFFRRHGPASVALCRFFPVVRSTVPLVAGITGMPRRSFLVANVASAFVWAPAHVFPAQLAGLSVDRLREGDWRSAVWLGLAVLACGVAVWMAHKHLTPRLLSARR